MNNHLTIKVQLDRKRVKAYLYRIKPAYPFYVRWCYRGQRHNTSTGKHDEAAAKTEAVRLVEESAREVHGSTLLDLTERYLAERFGQTTNAESRVREDAWRVCTQFSKWGPAAAASVGALDFKQARALIRDYLVERTKGKVAPPNPEKKGSRRPVPCKASRVDNDRRVLSRFFTWLIARELVAFQANPAHKGFQEECPRPLKVVKPPCTDEQAQSILGLARNRKWYPAVVFGLALGMRPRASCRVSWADVDLKARRLTIRDKTGTRPRLLSPWAVKELRAVKNRRQPKETDGVCCFGVYEVFKRFRRLCRRNKLPDTVTLQSLRRAFIRKFWVNKVDPQTVAAIAGNSVQIIQKHYAEMNAAELAGAVNLIKYDGKKR